MKKVIIFTAICFSIFSYSQTKAYDIYLIIEDNKLRPSINFVSDTLVWQKFSFKEQIPYEKKSYIDDKGVLNTKIKIDSSSDFSFTIEYKNLNNNNAPFILESKKIVNTLKFATDFNGQKNINLIKLIQKADEIYLIEKYKADYSLIKKVELLN